MGNRVSCIRSAQKHPHLKTDGSYSETGNGHVNCEECLRTYKPYTYIETLQRALDESGLIYHRTQYLDEPGYNSYRDEIRNLFPSVDDFMLCHGNFTKERRTKISASFLCFDCEKYLCAKCITQHSEHFTFSEDDKNNVDKWDAIETKIMQTFNTECDSKEEYIKQERAVLCNVVDVRDSVSVTEWEWFMSSWNGCFDRPGSELDRYYIVRDVCILNNNQTFLVNNIRSTHLKIYNTSSYELIDTIELPYIPTGITEIPSTDPSQTLIAVSFPKERKIDIMNIQRRPADVISSINVQGECYDLAYCNNKLITRCVDYLDGQWRHSIHVMKMSGEMINIIDLNKVCWLYDANSMHVHSQSETIYVRNPYVSVTCVSFTGQIFQTTKFTALYPQHICVDRDQNVYVMGPSLPIYRLSSDLSERVKIIDEDAADVGWVKSIVHHQNKIYMASHTGYVYIFNVD